jgi:hypothetical protein
MLAAIASAQTVLAEITRARYRTGAPVRGRRGLSFPAMSGDDPSVEDLQRRQRQQERAEREQIADAETGADADRHRRRAEKAGYLRRKLEERRHAERDAGDEPDLPPAA